MTGKLVRAVSIIGGRGSGVDSGRILEFLSDQDPEQKFVKPGPDHESLVILALAGVCVITINAIS